MENLNQVRKFKTIVCCLLIAFVAAFVAVAISFVKIGSARRADADYNKQLELLKAQKEGLEDDIDYLESPEGQDDLAKEQDKIPDGKTEIVIE